MVTIICESIFTCLKPSRTQLFFLLSVRMLILWNSTNNNPRETAYVKFIIIYFLKDCIVLHYGRCLMHVSMTLITAIVYHPFDFLYTFLRLFWFGLVFETGRKLHSFDDYCGEKVSAGLWIQGPWCTSGEKNCITIKPFVFNAFEKQWLGLKYAIDTCFKNWCMYGVKVQFMPPNTLSIRNYLTQFLEPLLIKWTGKANFALLKSKLVASSTLYDPRCFFFFLIRYIWRVTGISSTVLLLPVWMFS